MSSVGSFWTTLHIAIFVTAVSPPASPGGWGVQRQVFVQLLYQTCVTILDEQPNFFYREAWNSTQCSPWATYHHWDLISSRYKMAFKFYFAMNIYSSQWNILFVSNNRNGSISQTSSIWFGFLFLVFKLAACLCISDCNLAIKDVSKT